MNLSVEKYCGVMEMFRRFAKIENNIYYHIATKIIVSKSMRWTLKPKPEPSKVEALKKALQVDDTVATLLIATRN